MSAPQPPTEASVEQPPPRKRPSPWIAVALLGLLIAWFVVTQVVTYSGPPIEWHENLETAERLARDRGQRIFLVLHEPGDQTLASLDLNLFNERRVRERLAEMVNVRVTVRPGHPLLARFDTRDLPAMFVLEADSFELVGRPLHGKIDWRQFNTYVDPRPRGGAETP